MTNAMMDKRGHVPICKSCNGSGLKPATPDVPAEWCPRCHGSGWCGPTFAGYPVARGDSKEGKMGNDTMIDQYMEIRRQWKALCPDADYGCDADYDCDEEDLLIDKMDDLWRNMSEPEHQTIQARIDAR